MSKEENNKYIYTPLPEPIPITEQEWPDDVLPLVHTRTMAFNHENFIRECIEGLLMQKTTFPVQILIHDDASTDNTAAIIKEYEEKYPRLIKAYYQEENSYSKRSDIKGRLRKPFFQWITGKYVALCEGDDYWIDPLKLQKQVEIMEEDESIGIVHSGFIKYDMINNQKSEEVLQIAGDPFQHYLTTGKMRTVTVMIRNKYLPITTEVRKNPIIKDSPYGDRVSFLAIASQSKVVYLPDVTSVYRIFPGESASRYTDIRERYYVRLKITKVNYHLLKDLNINHFGYKLRVIFRIFYLRLLLGVMKLDMSVKFMKYLYNDLRLGKYHNSKYY